METSNNEIIKKYKKEWGENYKRVLIFDLLTFIEKENAGKMLAKIKTNLNLNDFEINSFYELEKFLNLDFILFLIFKYYKKEDLKEFNKNIEG